MKIITPEVLNRFLRYVQIYTSSQEDVEQIPSTERQFDLAYLLVQELHDIGISEIDLDEHCIIIANIPSNIPEDEPRPVSTVCFIAHMDTSPEEPGEHVHPQLVHYTGGEITFPNNPDLIILPDDVPTLDQLVGETLVTSDGTTLLGADDKAGVAEIMTALSYLNQHPEIIHGPIKIVFTPDEEVGHSVDALDPKE